MKRKILSLMLMAALTGIGGAGTSVYAQTLSSGNIRSQQTISTNDNSSFANIILTEDFESGSGGWVISNPGSGNPSIEVDSEGNHYLYASQGERAHHFLGLRPNTTYQITLDVAAGSSAVPAIVRISYNPFDQQPSTVEEFRFTNTTMQTHTVVFTTGEQTTDLALSLESYTTVGQARFDNIEVAQREGVWERQFLNTFINDLLQVDCGVWHNIQVLVGVLTGEDDHGAAFLSQYKDEDIFKFYDLEPNTTYRFSLSATQFPAFLTYNTDLMVTTVSGGHNVSRTFDLLPGLGNQRLWQRFTIEFTTTDNVSDATFTINTNRNTDILLDNIELEKLVVN